MIMKFFLCKGLHVNIFFIASKMNTLPFDIEWGIKNNDSD